MRFTFYAEMQMANKLKDSNSTENVPSLSEEEATRNFFGLGVGAQDQSGDCFSVSLALTLSLSLCLSLSLSLSLTHTHIHRSRRTNTFDQRHCSLCKKDSSSAKATCCWRALQEAVIETSAHLVLHTQSVVSRVTHSAKA